MSKSQYGSISHETTHLLSDSVRLARETEEIADNTSSVLLNQGEVLTSARSNLEDIHDISSAARTSLRNIKIREFRKKLYLSFIILLLFILNLIVLIVRFRNNGKLYPRY